MTTYPEWPPQTDPKKAATIGATIVNCCNQERPDVGIVVVVGALQGCVLATNLDLVNVGPLLAGALKQLRRQLAGEDLES